MRFARCSSKYGRSFGFLPVLVCELLEFLAGQMGERRLDFLLFLSRAGIQGLDPLLVASARWDGGHGVARQSGFRRSTDESPLLGGYRRVYMVVRDGHRHVL